MLIKIQTTPIRNISRKYFSLFPTLIFKAFSCIDSQSFWRHICFVTSRWQHTTAVGNPEKKWI